MKCPYCNGETSDELDFCSKCGRSIKRDNQKERPKYSALVVFLVILICVMVGFGIVFISRIDDMNKRTRDTTMNEEINDSDSAQEYTTDMEDTSIQEDTSEGQEPKENKLYSIVENPQYEALYVQKYGLMLEYPMHYIKFESDNEYSVLSLKDPNEAAILEFFACDIDAPIREFANVLTEEYDKNAKLLDESYTDDTFYKKYRDGNTDLILSGKSNDDSICFYRFVFAQFEEHIYQKYDEYINSHFIFKAE